MTWFGLAVKQVAHVLWCQLMKTELTREEVDKKVSESIPEIKRHLRKMIELDKMTREELRDHMRASRVINTIGNEDIVEWQVAFRKFMQAGGGRVDLDCGSCWNLVKEWLEK